ncbi:hypothetical protein EJ04DRAFT_517310 [Polyplosphaeria fusca]|uniref:C2H2-type domain-containing protein n=1 Tax=Polyplosphaeria fusca TaxID=682080 RepID=A0A9P4QM43_9PLEO|nr:hypothetical protein EJ04DRAFT_517310 [Polyplosphaeria fusca]
MRFNIRVEGRGRRVELDLKWGSSYSCSENDATMALEAPTFSRHQPLKALRSSRQMRCRLLSLISRRFKPHVRAALGDEYWHTELESNSSVFELGDTQVLCDIHALSDPQVCTQNVPQNASSSPASNAASSFPGLSFTNTDHDSGQPILSPMPSQALSSSVGHSHSPCEPCVYDFAKDGLPVLEPQLQPVVLTKLKKRKQVIPEQLCRQCGIVFQRVDARRKHEWKRHGLSVTQAEKDAQSTPGQESKHKISRHARLYNWRSKHKPVAFSHDAALGIGTWDHHITQEEQIQQQLTTFRTTSGSEPSADIGWDAICLNMFDRPLSPNQLTSPTSVLAPGYGLENHDQMHEEEAEDNLAHTAQDCHQSPINTWKPHRDKTTNLHSQSSQRSHNSRGPQHFVHTSQRSLRLHPSLNRRLPFAALMRSSSQQNAAFIQSVYALQDIRANLRARPPKAHRSNWGMVSMSGRGSVLKAAYPPIKCEMCPRTFVGQQRKRNLAGHRRRVHGYGSRGARISRSPKFRRVRSAKEGTSVVVRSESAASYERSDEDFQVALNGINYCR